MWEAGGFECRLCGFVDASHGKVLNHTVEKHLNGSKRCRMCTRKVWFNSLFKHGSVRHGKHCPRCKAGFTTSEMLLRHILQGHSPTRIASAHIRKKSSQIDSCGSTYPGPMAWSHIGTSGQQDVPIATDRELDLHIGEVTRPGVCGAKDRLSAIPGTPFNSLAICGDELRQQYLAQVNGNAAWDCGDLFFYDNTIV